MCDSYLLEAFYSYIITLLIGMLKFTKKIFIKILRIAVLSNVASFYPNREKAFMYVCLYEIRMLPNQR